MKRHRLYLAALIMGVMVPVSQLYAQNPLIMDQFTADPTARVFEGKVYMYPSHDILAPEGKGLRENWFCMEDYHVFSSENLVDWTDHGVIVTQEKVPWVDASRYAMWAPDCVFKNGKYYFYFPAPAKGGRGSIGVAIADKPYGPFKPEETPIAGVGGIDPCVLILENGDAYLYTSQNSISVSKLKDNMIEVEGEPKRIENLPQKGLIEGPFVFERNGLIYLTYPHVANNTERLEYAVGTDPMGPFEHKGVIMDENPSGCWTIHHSIIEYEGQWYLFYHDQQLSPDFDKNRSAKADMLFFNEDGTIQKVTPTIRGVGTPSAKNMLQIDRYSAISEEGTEVSFLDQEDTFKGWKVALSEEKAWVQFDRVDFGAKDLKSVNVQALSSTGGTVELRLDKMDGPILAKVEIGEGTAWKSASAKLETVPEGIHNLVALLPGEGRVEIDWVRFE